MGATSCSSNSKALLIISRRKENKTDEFFLQLRTTVFSTASLVKLARRGKNHVILVPRPFSLEKSKGLGNPSILSNFIGCNGAVGQQIQNLTEGELNEFESDNGGYTVYIYRLVVLIADQNKGDP